MVIEPIPHAGEADIADQGRLVDDVDKGRAPPEALGDNRDADTADMSDHPSRVTTTITYRLQTVLPGLLAGLGIQPAHTTTVVRRGHRIADRTIKTRLVIVDGGAHRTGGPPNPNPRSAMQSRVMGSTSARANAYAAVTGFSASRSYHSTRRWRLSRLSASERPTWWAATRSAISPSTGVRCWQVPTATRRSV